MNTPQPRIPAQTRGSDAGRSRVPQPGGRVDEWAASQDLRLGQYHDLWIIYAYFTIVNNASWPFRYVGPYRNTFNPFCKLSEIWLCAGTLSSWLWIELYIYHK